MSTRPKPFDGPQWEGWTKRERHNAYERELSKDIDSWVSCIGQLNIEHEGQSVCLRFKDPEHARQVAEHIQDAQNGIEWERKKVK